MENLDNNSQERSKKINWLIIVPLIVLIVVAGIFFYIDYKSSTNQPVIPGVEYKPQPISRKDNPKRAEAIIDNAKYGCAGPETIKPTITKSADQEWKIPKDGSANVISLGKYKIKNSIYLLLDIPKLWLYFVSDKLSDRDDKVYALEKSYVSKMTLVVNGFEKEIKLGGSEYMLIELSDYPLGDIYPYDKETYLEFEVLVELKCDNIQKGACLSNEGKSLEFLDGADISPMFRMFAVGCQEFTNDIVVDAKFSY